MADSGLCIGSLIVLVVVYKAFDWLLRRFYVGHYEDRYILITGCRSGFGNGLARRLDALGCHVFAGCHSDAGQAELRKACSTRLQPMTLDVGDPKSVKAAFEYIKTRLPPGKGLWGVVNNAGVQIGLGPVEWLAVDDYKRTADVNVYGLIDVTMTFLPLVKMTRGRVVNMSSVAGRFSIPVVLPYSVAKYGVEAFTDGLRRSLCPFGVSAILVEPGAYRTPIASAEYSVRALRASWEQATPEVKAEYGMDYPDIFETIMKGNLEKIGSTDLDPVVDAYVHALLGRFPRARYVVGTDAKFFLIPLSYAPEWLQDRAMFKLNPQALPASLRKDKGL